ncbi:TetR/AcrR family transcriptional regulator [Vibrio breoganii]
MSQKKDAILQTSLELMAKQGIDNTSTLEIAKATGVAKATLFHHFKTKTDLVDAVYLHVKEGFFTEDITDNSAKEQLLNIWTNSLEVDETKSLSLNFLHQYYSSPCVENTRRQQLKRQSLEPIYELIKRGQKQGIIQPTDPEYLLDIVYNLYMSTALYLDKPEVDSKAVVKDSLKVYERILFMPSTEG